MSATLDSSPSAGRVSERDLANAIRALAMDAVQAAKSGHPGMPMGMADVATVLFREFLRFDPRNPDWPDRDRFVLSTGHGSMLLYSLLYLTGYPDMRLEDLQNFRQVGSKTAGHPEYGHAHGVETTTGPLGQGLANAVGMALAERVMNARFGDELVDHWTYALAGDGCLMEGISHEACSLAGHLRLGRLIVLFDDNGISIDGPTSLAVSDDTRGRFEAYGWQVIEIDGHDPEQVRRALNEAKAETARPSLIACKTTIGFGAPSKAGKASAHGAPLGEEEIAGARKALGWAHPPFVVPDAVLQSWRQAGARGGEAQGEWQARLQASSQRATFETALRGDIGTEVTEAINAYKHKLSQEQPNVATRKASEMALEVLVPALPTLLGGSADLTGSNNTKTKAMAALDPATYEGRHIHYGVREHAMAAAMNGLALHGGVIPYGGTFLVFTDYNRPAIRLAALMGIRVIYVGTHDSIGLGEDGPTHQPIEHLSSLRAMPNLSVLRPADAVETVECWQIALTQRTTPAVLSLTRQNLPTLRTEHTEDNLSAKGAYVLLEASGERRATILATGSEVAMAVAAQQALAEEGIACAVVSMPCWELFELQEPNYRQTVLGTAPRVAVEAGVPYGWTRYVAHEDHVVGLTGFGASGPYKDVYAHFGLSAEAVAARVKSVLR